MTENIALLTLKLTELSDDRNVDSTEIRQSNFR